MSDGDVRLAILSFSAADPDGEDERYLRWHLLDHLPEQYSIPQLRLGQRWRALPADAAPARRSEPFLGAEHLVAYLFTDPIEGLPERWFGLGQELYDAGRMPYRLPKVHLGSYEVTGRTAAPTTPVRADVLPFTPYPGVHVVACRGALDVSGLTAVDGVAGVWSLSGWALPGRFDPSDGMEVALAFLEGSPAESSTAIASWLESNAAEADLLLSAGFSAVREPPA